MTVLITAVKRYRGDSTDAKPRPGIPQMDGTTPLAADLPAGSYYEEADTGRTYIWDGNEWDRVQAPDVSALSSLSAELTGNSAGLELRAIRIGLQRLLGEYGVEVDLLSEAAGTERAS